jgi:hypothetical protein
MKRTKPALVKMARSSPLISVFGGRKNGRAAMMRATSLAAVLVGLLTSCMVARYEEVTADKRRLSSGQEIAILWPDKAGETTPTVFVDYVSSRPSQLEDEARDVWREIRPELEQRDIRRVALRPTVIEKGFKWRDGKPSFWRASTSTYWYGRSNGGSWTAGDPGVSRREAPPNNAADATPRMGARC